MRKITFITLKILLVGISLPLSIIYLIHYQAKAWVISFSNFEDEIY